MGILYFCVMKKIALFFIKLYFTIVSNLFPSLAAKQALELFQKPSRRAFKPNELDFYKKANHFKLEYEEEQLDAYEIGAENDPLILLVHGWGSNLGRLSKIAFRLKDEGYRVVGINFPAHGYSKLKKTNMVFSKNALVCLIEHLNPQKPFSIVSHSFGSSVSALAMKELGLKINKLIFLTSANKTSEIFLDYKQLINLSDTSFVMLLKMSEDIVKLDFMKLYVEDILVDVMYDKMLIIHDRFDKMLPYHYATEIAESATHCELMTLENKGHSGMLFEPIVIDKVVDFLKR